MAIEQFCVYGKKIGYIVDINLDDIKRAMEFSEKIIKEDNQYNRMLPHEVRDKAECEKYRIQRTCVGKLGEIAFNKLLISRNIHTDTSSMFLIYQGQNVVDNFDFKTLDGMTVDIKTGFLSNHKRLIVNLEQFNNIKKNYYVGVKLTGDNKCYDKRLFDIYSIKRALIYGYAEYDYLNVKCNRLSFGEGESVYTDYVNLMEIDKLIEKFM